VSAQDDEEPLLFRQKSIISEDASGKKLISSHHFMSEVETSKLFTFDKKKIPSNFEEKSTLMLTSQAVDLLPSHSVKEKTPPLKLLLISQDWTIFQVHLLYPILNILFKHTKQFHLMKCKILGHL